MKNKIKEALNGIEEKIINESIENAKKLTKEGRTAFVSKMAEQMGKIKKLAKAQRPGKIAKIVAECAAEFPKARRSTGTRQDNAWLNSRKKAVLQLDKNTHAVITRHESVQAAHRASGVSDSSICYCCNKKYGFKSAGGFAWAYEDGYVAPEQKPEAGE